MVKMANIKAKGIAAVSRFPNSVQEQKAVIKFIASLFGDVYPFEGEGIPVPEGPLVVVAAHYRTLAGDYEVAKNHPFEILAEVAEAAVAAQAGPGVSRVNVSRHNMVCK